MAFWMYEPEVQAPPQAWSALTLNVLFEGADTAENIDALEKSDADFLCLQEVTPDFVSAFESALAKRYPYRRFEARQGTWGVGIASKHPLRNARVFRQTPHRMPALEAAVTLGGQPLRLACVHLFPPTAKRNANDSFWETYTANEQLRIRQADEIVGRFESVERLIVLGDLNDFDAALNTLLESGLSDACASSPSTCGATYPGATSMLPAVVTIDYILGRGVEFVQAARHKSGGSDHFPVQAWFRIR
ncbi:MAG: endonuclease/exonuclease/phosphatase family protein, partial [Myxococcota bacterium]